MWVSKQRYTVSEAFKQWYKVILTYKKRLFKPENHALLLFQTLSSLLPRGIKITAALCRHRVAGPGYYTPVKILKKTFYSRQSGIGVGVW